MTPTATADGSSLNDPRPANWVWHMDDDCWAARGWKSSTDNRGELTAVLELLRAIETARLAGKELLVQYDSQYIISSLTKWHHGWKKHGWRRADGEPILNSDLVRGLDAALVGCTVHFEWVRGHIGHPMNEAADSRARGAATAFQQDRPVPAGPSWTRGGRAPGNREARQAPSATSSNIPTAPQTDTLF